MRTRLLALAAALAAGSAEGSIPPPRALEMHAVMKDAPRPEERGAAAAFDRAAAAATPAARLAAMDAALAGLPAPTRFRGFVQCSRAEPLTVLGRGADALAAARECRRLRPDDPRTLWILGLAEFAAEPRDAARLLIAAIRADPSPLAGIDRSSWGAIARRLDQYEDASDLRVELDAALAAAGYGRAAEPADVLRDIRALLATGDKAGAAAQLARITSPEAALELLVSRRYGPIWREAEAWSQGTLLPQRDASIAAAKSAFDADPSMRLRLDYAAALTGAGEAGEALKLLRAGIAAPAVWDVPRFDLVAATAYAAGLLQEMGRGEEGLALLRSIKATLPDDLPARRNLMPNEARLLVALGHSDAGLTLLDNETPPAGQVADPGALDDYTALRICALARAGQAAAARAAFVAMPARYAVNRPAVAMALRCAGTIVERRTAWLARLDDREKQDAALLAWTRANRPGAAGSMDSDEGDLARLRGDAGLRARFEALGRTLPPSYDAALDGWPARSHGG